MEHIWPPLNAIFYFGSSHTIRPNWVQIGDFHQIKDEKSYPTHNSNETPNWQSLGRKLVGLTTLEIEQVK